MSSFSFASIQARKTLLVTTRQPPVHWDSTEHPPPNYRSTMSTMSLGRFSFVQALPARRSLCSGLKALISMERGKQSGKAGRTRHDSFLRTIDASTSFPYHPTSPFRSCIRILSSRCPTLSSSSYENTSNMGLVRGGIRGSLHWRELVPEKVTTSSKEVVSIHLQAVEKNDDSYIGHLVHFDGSWWMGLALGFKFEC